MIEIKTSKRERFLRIIAEDGDYLDVRVFESGINPDIKDYIVNTFNNFPSKKEIVYWCLFTDVNTISKGETPYFLDTNNETIPDSEFYGATYMYKDYEGEYYCIRGFIDLRTNKPVGERFDSCHVTKRKDVTIDDGHFLGKRF